MRKKVCSLLTTLGLALLYPSLVSAGGILLYEIASPDVGFASAGWCSRCDNAATVFTNPAGMTRLDSRQIQFGAMPIYQHVEFDPNGFANVPGSHGDASQWVPNGSLFYVQPINDCWTWGVGTCGYFGSELNYNTGWVGRYYTTKVQLQGYSLIPSIAYRFDDKLSFGVGANIMYGTYEQKSKIRNALDPVDDGSLKLKDNDLAYGAVVGILYEPTPCTRFGLQYLSPVEHKFADRPHVDNIGPILTEALRLTGILDSKVRILARVPQSLMFSVYQELNECWAVMGDIGWQQWSRFQKASIALSNRRQTTLTFIPKYRDTWHVAGGVEWFYSPTWTFTTGLAYDSSPVDEKERTADFVVGKQWRIGAGARWNYSQCLVFNVSYEYQTSGDLKISQNRGPLAGDVSGTYNNVSGHFLSLNATCAF